MRDRYRLRRLHPQVLQGAGQRRRSGCGPRRDRRLGAPHVRMDGALAGLQGGLPGDAGRQRRLLHAVPGQRPAVVSRGAGARPLPESCPRAAAGGPTPAPGRGRRRLRARREGDRRGADRQRREGRRHRFGPHPRQFHRASVDHADQDQGVRRGLHRVHGHAGGEADLPSVLRDDGRGDGQPVRLPPQ